MVVPCKSYQYRHPDTNRCRNKSGYKPSRRRTTRKSRSRTGDEEIGKGGRVLVPCKPHQYRHPDTNRCRNKPPSGTPSRKSPRKSSRKSPRKSSRKSPRKSSRSKREGDCIKRSELPLRAMQKRVVRFMNTHRGLLVVHGTGTGKTLTAVTASQCYLDKHPRGNVVFIGPASLTSNFKKELNKYGEEDHSKYDFYSFDTFYNEEKKRPGSVDLSNSLLIIDEVHNLRNPTGKKSEKIVEATFRARKRLLLTATPFVNNMMDFIPLINMVHGRRMVGTYKEKQRGEVVEWMGKSVDSKNIATFRYLLKDIVDVEIGRQDMAEFPRKIEHFKNVPMTNEYYRRYIRIIRGENLYGIVFSKPHVFYNGYRRAVNKAGPEYYSTKVEEALPIISRGKSIIYTNWIEFGVKPIERALKREGISYMTFTGSTKVSDRQEIVDGFNNDEFDALILTKAGGEGLDLKGVKSVIVMDPTWNDSGLQQIIGRAIRYKSHAHLSESQRKVDVYYMVLAGPSGEKTDAGYPLGDVLLYDIIKKKNEINATLTAIMQEL